MREVIGGLKPTLVAVFSEVKEESEWKTNTMEADTRPILPFHLPQEELRSQVLELWDSKITLIL